MMRRSSEYDLCRYLVSRRAIGAGEVILQERALVCGPSQAEHVLCLECLREVSSHSYSLLPFHSLPPWTSPCTLALTTRWRKVRSAASVDSPSVVNTG